MTIETRPIVEPKVNTTADVLRHAARYIEEHGWCQGSFREDDGRVCMIGAVSAVTGGYDARGSAAHQFLMGDPVDLGLGPMNWNDTPGRTVAEVTAALRAAADEAER